MLSVIYMKFPWSTHSLSMCYEAEDFATGARKCEDIHNGTTLKIYHASYEQAPGRLVSPGAIWVNDETLWSMLKAFAYTQLELAADPRSPIARKTATITPKPTATRTLLLA
ncbi:hypothetical protein L6452_21669 [Arctium lappa]|uniref:Uncharacterized protein n=1 Tax=Arctium lappa TaxID=4217 RepID=A0ACB9AXP2_ARCLA|nr:hypothetical protein L6452_21669 [Arctium lappa]